MRPHNGHFNSDRQRKQFERRRFQQDPDVRDCGGEKTERIDLGLAILSAVAVPGVCYTRAEIAIFAGCTEANIYQIEAKALRKLRNALRMHSANPDPILEDFAHRLFNRRHDARRTLTRRG